MKVYIIYEMKVFSLEIGYFQETGRRSVRVKTGVLIYVSHVSACKHMTIHIFYEIESIHDKVREGERE